MKVLHVIPYTSSVYGGPVVSIVQMSSALISLGVEVDVVTTTANGISELEITTCGPVVCNGVRYFYFKRLWPKFWMFSWALRCWLYRHVGMYDLVHIHGLFAYTTLPACAAARKFDKPYIITTHGMLDPWCFSHKSWKKLPYYYLLERRNLIHAAAIHVTSAFESIGVTSLGFDSKIDVVPLSVMVPDGQSRVYRDDRPLVLLFLSRVVPIKGLPTLLQAVALFRSRYCIPIMLKIAGLGSDEYLLELKTQAERLEISECVEFVGFVQGEIKSQILAEADIFVLPSYHENFSLSSAEAMAVGLPVIVSDQVGIAQEISDASAGIIVPVDSPISIADAIKKFCNSEYRRQAGENGRKLVQQRFSMEKFGSAMHKLYLNAIANHISYDIHGRVKDFDNK